MLFWRNLPKFIQSTKTGKSKQYFSHFDISLLNFEIGVPKFGKGLFTKYFCTQHHREKMLVSFVFKETYFLQVIGKRCKKNPEFLWRYLFNLKKEHLIDNSKQKTCFKVFWILCCIAIAEFHTRFLKTCLVNSGERACDII